MLVLILTACPPPWPASRLRRPRFWWFKFLPCVSRILERWYYHQWHLLRDRNYTL
jgi:hypothetical protein